MNYDFFFLEKKKKKKKEELSSRYARIIFLKKKYPIIKI